MKLFDQQAVQPNRSNDTFFLNLHRIGYTVFLILCLMKLTQIHEDPNICVEERRIIKSVLRLRRDTKVHYLEDCVEHVKRIPQSTTFMHGKEKYHKQPQ